MLIKVIIILIEVIGMLLGIIGAIYTVLKYKTDAPVNYEGMFRGVLLSFVGVMFIVFGKWLLPDILNDALEKRQLSETRSSQYTYVYDGTVVEYRGINKLKYNSLDYDITYDDNNKLATISKTQKSEYGTILLCCSMILLCASIMLRKATSGS